MKIDVLVAEIGSTTTVVNAFNDIRSSSPVFIGQGQSPTTVLEGDVGIGLNKAIKHLAKALGADEIDYETLMATSSAAGGLKMTVHGLVYDMTAKAAKEAALGAGANLHMVTAGKLRRTDLKKIQDIGPNIILIAGGVDYGERETAIENAERIAALPLKVPVLYAGNIENQEEIKLICEEAGKADLLYLCENVYPRIDDLNVEPTRKVIQSIFEKHITEAPGMQGIRKWVTGPIIPTPGAVMEAAKLLKGSLGDLLVIDVGGATTDVHSVTEGSEEISRILLSPEPVAKRTVEGDLGVFINMKNIVALIGEEVLCERLKIEPETLNELISHHQAIPKTPEQKAFVEVLTEEAVKRSGLRHAGSYRTLYGGSGKKTFAEGKDLTSIEWLIGTGGALTRLPHKRDLIHAITHNPMGERLLPHEDSRVLVDEDYIMASIGVLSKRYPEAALVLMKRSLNLIDKDIQKDTEKE